MKYLLMFYHPEEKWHSMTEEERQKIKSEYGALREELAASGKFLGGSQLHPVATASTVRVRDGKPLITDGPFAETHEQLGGYFLVDARDLDEANQIAAQTPTARTGSVEVRPLVEMPSNASG